MPCHSKWYYIRRKKKRMMNSKKDKIKNRKKGR